LGRRQEVKYYLIVTGKGKLRRILTYCKVRKSAIEMLNRAIFDYGHIDARLVTSTIEPPTVLYFKPLEAAHER
jgi:hypothetical protein